MMGVTSHGTRDVTAAVGIAGRPVRYHLRVPFGADFSDTDEEALWRIAREAQIDEALFFGPHAEERSPGLGTRDEIDRCVTRLSPLFARLRGEGIAPSVNIWWTVAFSDFPAAERDMRATHDFRWAVDLHGVASRSAACPQDPAWRSFVGDMYRRFASLEPAVLWIDDDVRMTLRSNHNAPCFCDECIGEMGRRTGELLDRGALLAGILADPPNPVRDAWLRFQNDLCCDVVGMLSAAVHETSPATRVGLMFSSFEIHAAEGRDWERFVGATGGPAPYCRPGVGVYCEATAVEIAGAFANGRLSVAALPRGVAVAPEIENYPHSRFGKSMALTRAGLVCGQLLGAPEVTLSVYRFGGQLSLETRREDLRPALLRENKPYLQAIADLCIEPAQFEGVSLYFHEETCRHVHGAGDVGHPIFLYRQRPWDTSLPLLGMATRYGTGPVTAFSGEQIACLDEEALDRVFSQGVLLDARAAEALIRMGAGHLIGAESRLDDVGATLERIEDAEFGGLAGDVINLRWEGATRQFDWKADARAVSVVLDYHGRSVGHGVVLYENALGGRVAVVPHDGQLAPVTSLGVAFPPLNSPGFLSLPRQAQLKDVVDWLYRKPMPLFVPNAPNVFPLLVRQEQRLIAAILNLSPDPIEDLALHFAEPDFPLSVARHLQPDGTWRELDASLGAASGRVVLRTDLSVCYLESVVLVLE